MVDVDDRRNPDFEENMGTAVPARCQPPAAFSSIGTCFKENCAHFTQNVKGKDRRNPDFEKRPQFIAFAKVPASKKIQVFQ